MRRKIAIILINLSLGLFSAYLFLICDRETYISSNMDNIACEIIKLDLRHGARTHPTAYIIYQNKEYITGITDGDGLQTGFNNTTFFYDEMLDRCFCRNSGVERGLYVILVIFALSFLLWLSPNDSVHKNSNNYGKKR